MIRVILNNFFSVSTLTIPEKRINHLFSQRDMKPFLIRPTILTFVAL